MKKLFTILLLVAVGVTLAACGPNSNYYNLKSKSFYYYKDQDFALNPYDLLYGTVKENDELKELPRSKQRNLAKYYNVEVEWRKTGEKTYQKMTTDEDSKFAYLKDGMIYTDNPRKVLGNNASYDFKIHFIDKKTDSEESMMNLIGQFTFIQSPANAKVQELTQTVEDTYNLLNNIEEKNAEGDTVDLTEVYGIEYSVTKDDVPVDVADNGDVTFDSAGTYDVTVVLTKVPESSSTADATSSASESGASSDAIVLTIVYTIVANEE